MERLECHVQTYSWGKVGSNSEVARLFSAGHPDFQIGHTTPYSELWMGTHPDGPARVRASAEKLSRHIAKSESAKSLQKEEREEIHLPFIMKIMSINQSLSLQVHPTKEQAARLHAKDPGHYPDAHHKPELAYAITRFELLCGFRPADEIVKNMKAFPELRAVMGEAAADHFEKLHKSGHAQESSMMKNALERCFSNMLYTQVDEPEFVKEQLRAFTKRLLVKKVRGCLIEDTVRVIEKMLKDFPGDIGCFSPLYLNHMILQPGQCCYYAAEELHAYLSGECVECVGCSNNTIRAALTPKFIDRESLIEVLNYRMTNPDYYLVPAERLDQFPAVVEYAPDCKDFTLHQIEILQTRPIEFPAYLPPLECGSIMVIVEGEGFLEELDSTNPPRKVARGDIFYIQPSSSVRFNAVTSDRLLAYRTFSHEEGPDHSKRTVAPGGRNVSAAAVPKTIHTTGVPVKKSIFAEITMGSTKTGEKKNAFGLNIFDVESEMDGFC